MNTNIFILCCISLAVSLMYIKKQSNLLHSATEHLKTIPTSIKLVDDSEPPTYRTVRKKNYITINGDSNMVTYQFNKTLKNVQNIELISATVPRSQYRINELNDKMYVQIDNNTPYKISLTNGVYLNISEILLEINTQLYLHVIEPEFGLNDVTTTNYLNVVADNMNKHCIFLTNLSNTVTINFTSTLNTPKKILGISDSVGEIILNETMNRSNAFMQGCYSYIHNLYRLTGSIVNNLPKTYYDNLLMYPKSFPYDFSSWKIHEGTNRLNISQQLYLDVTIDNISYWDGTNILNRIYVDELLPVSVYDRKYPTYRTLSDPYLKLDKITLRFHSITDEGNTENRSYEDIHSKKNPYDFNGLGYSLQLEIITKNKELII